MVLQLVHRLLDAALRAVELASDIVPFSFIGGFDDRLGVWCDRTAHADLFGQRQHALADLLDRRCVLRLHGDKTVRNHGAEQERHAGALHEIATFIAPDVFLPVHGPELVEGTEDFVRQWHDHIFDILKWLEVDLLRWSFGAGCA